MFLAQNERGWNVLSKAMKYVTAMTYGGGGGLYVGGGKDKTWNYRGSLLRGEVGWIRAWLDGVRRLEVLGDSLDLSQVFQLDWVIVGGNNDLIILEAHL